MFLPFQRYGGTIVVIPENSLLMCFLASLYLCVGLLSEDADIESLLILYKTHSLSADGCLTIYVALQKISDLTKDTFGFLFSNLNRPCCSVLLFERNLFSGDRRLSVCPIACCLNGSNWKKTQIKETKDGWSCNRRSFKQEGVFKSALALLHCSRRFSISRHVTPNTAPHSGSRGCYSQLVLQEMKLYMGKQIWILSKIVVRTVMGIHILVCCVTTPWRPVGGYQRFGSSYCFLIENKYPPWKEMLFFPPKHL